MEKSGSPCISSSIGLPKLSRDNGDLPHPNSEIARQGIKTKNKRNRLSCRFTENEQNRMSSKHGLINCEDESINCADQGFVLELGNDSKARSNIHSRTTNSVHDVLPTEKKGSSKPVSKQKQKRNKERKLNNLTQKEQSFNMQDSYAVISNVGVVSSDTTNAGKHAVSKPVTVLARPRSSMVVCQDAKEPMDKNFFPDAYGRRQPHSNGNRRSDEACVSDILRSQVAQSCLRRCAAPAATIVRSGILTVDSFTLADVECVAMKNGTQNFYQFEITQAEQQGRGYHFKHISVKRRQHKQKVFRSEHNSQEMLLQPLLSEKEMHNSLYRCIMNMLRREPIAGMIIADGREAVQQETLPYLQMQYIFPLKRKKERFPKAVYFCRLCDYHIQSISHAKDHVRKQEHIKAKQERDFRDALHSLPAPTDAQCAALLDEIQNQTKNHGRSMENILHDFFPVEAQLTNLFKKTVHTDCYVRIYGSVHTGFALESSNVNLELVYPEGQINHSIALQKAHYALKTTEGFHAVEGDYGCKWPCVRFQLKQLGNTPFVLSVRNWQAHDISTLLKLYTRIWPPLVMLAQAVRCWAKYCVVDDSDCGGIPSYALDLMLVHYLQQRNPAVLPVLHELNTTVEQREKNEYQNDFEVIRREFTLPHDLNVADLLIGFFKFYVVRDNQNLVVNIRRLAPVLREEKGWNTKRIAIEDPFLPAKNLGAMTVRMFDYFFHCIVTSYQYFAIPQLTTGPLFDVQKDVLSHNFHSFDKKHCNSSHNEEGSSTQLVTRYTGLPSALNDAATILNDVLTRVELELESFGISVSDAASEKKYTRETLLEIRRICSECDYVSCGDFLGKVNCNMDDSVGDTETVKLASPMSSACNRKGGRVRDELQALNHLDSRPPEQNAMVDVGNEDGNGAYTHSIDPCTELPSPVQETDLLNVIDECDHSTKGNDSPIAIEESSPSLDHDEHAFDASPLCKTADVEFLAIPESDLLEENADETVVDGLTEDGFNREKLEYTRSSGGEAEPELPGASLVERKWHKLIFGEFSRKAATLAKSDFVYKFQQVNFNDGRKPEITCSFCGEDGHQKNKCPEKELPPVCPLLPLTRSYIYTMNRFLEDVKNKYAMSARRIAFQQRFQQQLQDVLRQQWPDACCHLFGSSCNGFGFHHSDLDVCLTFEGHASLPEGYDPIKIIRMVARILTKCPMFRCVQPVIKAKVPIVKFVHVESQLEGDVSLYNTLALRNTEMLYTYARLDPRVPALGYIAKVFAKALEIGDASKGSLSSYAYIIMLIHYLQHTTPPVLPVLQQLVPPNSHIDHMQPPADYIVDSWNTYFLRDMHCLPTVWPDGGRNKESLTELWLGFLRYYVEQFDFDMYAVCIRRFEPLTKFEKLWTDKPMALEDPFNLNHNLGGGLSRRMFQYIKKSFIRGRELFGTSLNGEQFFRLFGNVLSYQQLEHYYFTMLHAAEPPPRDRLCRLCGHVGHFVEQCPRKRSNRHNFEEDDLSDMDLEGGSPIGKSSLQKFAEATADAMSSALSAQKNRLQGNVVESDSAQQKHIANMEDLYMEFSTLSVTPGHTRDVPPNPTAAAAWSTPKKKLSSSASMDATATTHPSSMLPSKQAMATSPQGIHIPVDVFFQQAAASEKRRRTTGDAIFAPPNVSPINVQSMWRQYPAYGVPSSYQTAVPVGYGSPVFGLSMPGVHQVPSGPLSAPVHSALATHRAQFAAGYPGGWGSTSLPSAAQSFNYGMPVEGSSVSSQSDVVIGDSSCESDFSLQGWPSTPQTPTYGGRQRMSCVICGVDGCGGHVFPQ